MDSWKVNAPHPSLLDVSGFTSSNTHKKFIAINITRLFKTCPPIRNSTSLTKFLNGHADRFIIDVKHNIMRGALRCILEFPYKGISEVMVLRALI